MVKHIASITDGRVVPWFSDEDPVPTGFVVVPDELFAKYQSGKIADGKALARAAIAANAEVGTAKLNVATPPPPKKTGDADPSAVNPATIGRGEPSSPEVTHFPTQGRTTRV